ncbi:MAG: hypothetical protein CME59_17975 [Halioglobus sp.]|nr:hypothetical protein [Halioglobus sp.]
MQYRIVALSVLFALLPLRASADLLRYDVTVAWAQGGAEVATGYMIFEDAGPVPGDIWPSIVDWYFDVDGFVVSPANTVAAELDASMLTVDADYHILSDFRYTPSLAPGVCFSTSAQCYWYDDVNLSFSRDLQGFSISVRNDLYFAPVGSGRGTYSDPIEVSISLPGTAGLLAIALAGLVIVGFRVSPVASAR